VLRTFLDYLAGNQRPLLYGLMAGAALPGVLDHATAWLRYQLTWPVTLGAWLCWPFRAAARRRYRLTTVRKDIAELERDADAIADDLEQTRGRLAELLAAENAGRWPLEPVR